MSRSIVFVHGMFVTPRCWDRWVERYQQAGLQCHAPPWPGRDRPIAELRARHPDPELGKLTLPEIVDAYDAFIRALPEPPALIGHSMGGLIVQLLLQRGLGAAGVAIDSAPPKGVSSAKWSFLKSNWPVISPFADKLQPYFMPLSGFIYAFAHTLDAEAQRAAYQQQVVPESRQVGRGPLGAAAKIDFTRPHAPLLLIAGELDRIIPASLNRANHAKYRDPGSVTAYKEFPGRTHYIIGQPGWQEVADFARDWLAAPT